MKKQIIGALVGALLLFIWQFLSWTLLGVHMPEMQYTENQDAIMEVLGANLEDGHYLLPSVPMTATEAEVNTYLESMQGNPRARIQYIESLQMSMEMNMAKGFLVNFISCFLLIWVLLKFATLDFKTVVLSTLAVGFIGYLTVNYIDHIWWGTRSLGYLIDCIASWGLVGLWLGFWLTRE